MRLFFKNNYLLHILLLITLLKGVVWAAAVPLFQAPDEQFHYATIQYHALPKGYEPVSKDFPSSKTTFGDINTQNLSPELRSFLEKTEFDKIRWKPDNQMTFAENSSFGTGEEELRNGSLSRFIERFPPWLIESYGPAYYKSMGLVEKALSGESIMERVFAIRLFSVFLGTLLVLCSYFIFRELFLDKTESVMLAGVVSFQPMLTFIDSSINIDPLLFLSFAVFILGSVRILRGNIDIWSILLVLAGMKIGIYAKQPGYFTLAALPTLILFYFLLYQKDRLAHFSKNQRILGTIALFATALGTAWFAVRNFFPGITKPLLLAPKYFLHEIKYEPMLGKTLSYWGNFGWFDAPLARFFVSAIWFLLFLSVIGMARYFTGHFFSKSQKSGEERIFFFQMLYFLFFVTGVSLMIHFVNLQFVNPANVAEQPLGTQGRYFFPSLIPRMSLLAFGFAWLLPKIEKKWIFLTFLAAMVFLNLWSLFGLIIPRYYF